MDDVLALLERKDMGDQEMVDYLAHTLQEPSSPRPSIETLLHGFLPAAAVIHTHADAIVSLTNNDRAADVLREVYGGEVIALPSEERRRVALSVVPALRGLVSRDRRVVVSFDDSPDVLDFACSGEAGDLSRIGPATPDHTIYTKRLPCFVPVADAHDPTVVKDAIKAAIDRFVVDYTAYVDA